MNLPVPVYAVVSFCLCGALACARRQGVRDHLTWIAALWIGMGLVGALA